MAGAFFAALLAAVLAAASVGSAATASTQATMPKLKLNAHSWGGAKGNVQTKNGGLGLVSAGMSGPASLVKPTVADVQAQAKLNGRVNRPTRAGHVGASAASGESRSAPAVNIPHIHSLPIQSKTFDAAQVGLNNYWNEATHGGFGSTPPDQALAEGHGQVLQAVNTNLVVTDTNFNHPLGVVRLEDLFAPAIFVTGEDFLTDPKALYDNATNRWFLTVAAIGPGYGSSVYIAVSYTPDANGPWLIYVLDTSTDGTTCGLSFGCLGDQPLLGADRYSLDITTNSFDQDSGAFNGVQLYEIDKTQLVNGVIFPTLWFGDIGGNFDYPGFIGNTCGGVFGGPTTGFCLGSMQPATTPNQSFVSDHLGTEFFLESLDPLGSNDNRIVFWALTDTSGVSFTPGILSGVVVTVEAYGFPVTDACMTMPQNPAVGLSPIQCGFATQPSVGNTPFCDIYLFFFLGTAGACEPGPIQANDDRMNAVTSVKPGSGPALVYGGVNTDAAISDPLGALHRNDAIAYFSVSVTQWDASNLVLLGAKVNGQGYIGNWQNHVVYPSIAVTPSSGGTAGAIVYSLTGNNTNPSVAVSKFGVHSPPTSIGVAVPGNDVLDDFCNSGLFFCGFDFFNFVPTFFPRFGDYSAAVADGHDIYLAAERTNPSCDDTTFLFSDGTCTFGLDPWHARGFVSNWATGLVRTHT